MPIVFIANTNERIFDDKKNINKKMKELSINQFANDIDEFQHHFLLNRE